MKGTGGDPGWYFVLQERPGEARFGLEVSPHRPIETFDDVAWPDAMPGITPGQFLPASALASVLLTRAIDQTSDPDKHDQWSDDTKGRSGQLSALRAGHMCCSGSQ